ncbi:MAG: TetR/AcrR family transcriptional regulator [Sphingomonas sp.]|nr:TetR/AcrR family transcriptional regulator [Sphingomonas sp.]
MARTQGARGSDYDAKRASLIAAMHARLVARDLPLPSLRELAAAAGVTMPTLRHYFGKRDDVIIAVLDAIGQAGAGHIAQAAASELPFAESIAAALRHALAGLRQGLDDVHMLGLREGMVQGRLGPAYLDAILEPSLQAIEARLSAHQARGEMRRGNPRHAALALLSPLVLAALHQAALGGGHVRPLDLDALASDLAVAFVRAHAG